MLRRYSKRMSVLHRMRAALVGARAMPRQEGELTPLRYALVGAGAAARSHLASIAHQPGVNLVGIADPTDPKEVAYLWRLRGYRALRRREGDVRSIETRSRLDLYANTISLQLNYPRAPRRRPCCLREADGNDCL